MIQYTEAYNASVAEVSRLQEESAKLSSKDALDCEGGEVHKLKAQVKTKDIEINDLTETLDRLTSEKDDLKQEIDDLAKQNEELRCADEQGAENMVDIALYDEVRTNLDEASDRCRQLTLEVTALKDDLEKHKQSKLEDSATIQQLKEEIFPFGDSYFDEV